MNKKIIQILLIVLLLFLLFFFYNKLFKVQKTKVDSIENSETTIEDRKNLIQNLKYEVNFEDNKKYKITAKESEIVEKDGIEIVYMKNVIAIFVDERNTVLEIRSSNAIFNSSTYNTSFSNNI